MVIDDAVSEVAARLGNRTDLNAKIKTQLGNVQEFTLERAPVLPWYLVTEDTWTTTSSGEERLLLPTDFLREFEPSSLWYYDSTLDAPWNPLTKLDYEDIRYALGRTLTATGKPTHYSMEGKYFRLGPEPDGAYRIQMRYYKQDANARTLNGQDTNLWLTNSAELLLAMACVKMARQLRYRDEAQEQFQRDQVEQENIFFKNHHARIHANRRYVMGI